MVPYGFIYITTNTLDGKKYIGQRKFIRGWKTYLGSGKLIRAAIKIHGRENFTREIVAIAYSAEELNRLEIEFIKNHNAVESKDYYNIADGGNNGNKFAGKTDEEMADIKRKIRENHSDVSGENHPMWGITGENHPRWGRTHSEESRKK